MLTNDLVNGAYAYVSRHGCKYRMTRYSARRCVTLFGNFHDLEIHLSLFLNYYDEKQKSWHKKNTMYVTIAPVMLHRASISIG